MAEKTLKFSKLRYIMEKAEQLTVVRAIRGGLLNITPVLIIGAFAVILNSFPVTTYQEFIKNFAGGLLSDFFEFINKATFGVLGVYMTASVSRSYMRIKAEDDAGSAASAIGVMIASLMSFFIFAGAYLPSFGTDSIGPKSMFLAIITGIGASSLYHRIYTRLSLRRQKLYTTGADRTA